MAATGVEEYDHVVGGGALQAARWRHGFLSAIPSERTADRGWHRLSARAGAAGNSRHLCRDRQGEPADPLVSFHRRYRYQSRAGSRIDVPSTSRQGQSDYGVNAARICAYVAALRKRIG